MPTAVILRGSQELAPPAITAKPLRGDDAARPAVNMLPSHRIRPDHYLRKMLRAFGGKIRRNGAGVIEPDHGATRRFRDHVVVDYFCSCARHHRDADADEG